MPLTPEPAGWKAAGRFAGLPVLCLIVAGFTTDLLAGLPVSSSSRAWTAWLCGILALGVLYLVGEGGVDWIGGRDKITHPLWRRLWHLTLLLGFLVGSAAVAVAVIRIVA